MDRELIYFDMRGRAESSRLLLMDHEVQFDDVRIKSAEELSRLQSTSPFGHLPVLRDMSHLISESNAILRHISRMANDEPSELRLQAAWDEAHEALASAQEELWLSSWVSPDPYEGKVYSQSALVRRLAGLDKLAGRNPGRFWFGEQPSRVDYLAFAFLDEIDAFFPERLRSFPTLADLHHQVSDRPNLQSYLRSSAQPAVFGVGKSGLKVDTRRPIPTGQMFECPWDEPVALDQFFD